MKKIFALGLAVILVSALTARANEITFGIRGGLNISTLTGDDADMLGLPLDDLTLEPTEYSPEPIVGLSIGGFINIPLNDTLSFQPEILYTQKGAKYDLSYTDTYDWAGSTIEENLEQEFVEKLSYLEFPLLLKATFSEEGKLRPILYAGPSIGFNVSARLEYDIEYIEKVDGVIDPLESYSDSGDEDLDDISSVELGLTIGGGFEINNFTIDARYNMGLTSLDDGGDFDVKNSVISILAGYRF